MLKLLRSYADNIIAHARKNAPEECCGIIAGSDGRTTKLYRAFNAVKKPHRPYRYEVHTKNLVRINNDIIRNGWDLFAIYHSHTGTEAYPSPTDVRLATWPEAYYLIVSLKDVANPVLRAFRIQDGEVKEEELQVV